MTVWFRLPSLARVALALVLLAGAISGIGTRGARADDSGLSMPVFSIACDAYVQMQNTAKGEGIPSDCRAIEGVTISASDQAGDFLAKCTTDANGTCKLAISPNGTRIFRQSTKNIPEGYVPESSIQRVFTYTEFAEVVFENYKTDVLPTNANGVGTVKIVSRICPDKYEGSDFATDCGAIVPGSTTFLIANSKFSTGGSDGNASLRKVPAGDVAVFGGQTAQTGDVSFGCVESADPSTAVESSLTLTVQVDGTSRDFTGHVTLTAKDSITCFWYQIPNLDRGLRTKLELASATGDREGTWIDTFGDISLYLLDCPSGYVAKDLQDAATNCTTKAADIHVAADSSDGSTLASGITDADGIVKFSLSGKQITEFTIGSPDRPNVESDVIGCFASTGESGGDVTSPMYQSVDQSGGSWSIPGFGDDQAGVVCLWYMAG